MMKTKMYEYLLSVIGSLYFMGSLFIELPHIEQVLGIMFIINVVFGIIYKLLNKSKDGTFMIDTSNIEKDIYRLQLDTPLDELSNKKTIVLTIQNDTYLSKK